MAEQNKHNIDLNNTYYRQRKDGRLLHTLKSFWYACQKTKLYKTLRHSPVNPYHAKLQKIEADTLEEAREIAINCKLPYFLFKNVRVSTDEPYSLVDEAGKRNRIFRNGRNALDVLPRNADGIPDLKAGDKILFAFIPVDGPSIVGHVAMQYKNYVVNRMNEKMETKSILPLYGKDAVYYYVYMKDLPDITEKKLISAIKKANIVIGGKYNLLVKNCATAIDYVLKLSGIKDLNQLGPDKHGITISLPGNNPFNVGIQDWCCKHGVRVTPDEVARSYEYNDIMNYQDRAQEYETVRKRIQGYLKTKSPIKKCTRQITNVLPDKAKSLLKKFGINKR